MEPFQCDLQPQIQETHRTTHTDTTTRCKIQIRNQNDPSRNRRTQEVPFIAGCNHFTRKNRRFRAPASSPKQSPGNILMQPLQCVSQHPVANLHVSTQIATKHDNNHAAIPMRSATTDIQETHRTTHTDTTTRCRTQRSNQSRPERPQPHPPHTGGTFHRRLQPLYTEK